MGWIDNLLSERALHRDVYKIRALGSKDVGKRQIFELLSDFDPLFAVMVSELTSDDVQASLCLLFLFFKMLRDIHVKCESEPDLGAAILQKIAEIVTTNILEDSDLQVNILTLDLFLQELDTLPFGLQKILRSGIAASALGMADFLGRNVTSEQEYTLLCHHLLGNFYLTMIRIFCSAHEENPMVANAEHLASSIGVFIAKSHFLNQMAQKGSSISNSSIWPEEILRVYTSEHGVSSVLFLHHMIFDALRHLPEICQFMIRLENAQLFRLLCPDLIEALHILVHLSSGQSGKTCLTPGAKYAIYNYTLGLSDLQDLISAKLASISFLLKSDDPTSGQMHLLLKRLRMLCSRKRNRSLTSTKTSKGHSLSIGTIIELLIYVTFGLMIALILIKTFA